MQAQTERTQKTIIQRLDAIESARKATLTNRYRTDYPDLEESDVSHLADLLATTRIRLIAENALALLPDGQIDQVLSQFE
jgi:hypothetical protein